MARLKTYLLALATVGVAFAIGYVMQHAAGSNHPDIAASDVDVDSIVDTSFVAPRSYPVGRTDVTGADMALPAVATLGGAGTDLPARILLAAVQSPPADAAPVLDKSDIFDCGITLRAEPRAGALVGLALSAPCLAHERVTIHHHGMMFTAMTDADGMLAANVPALSENALFVAAFDNGDGMTVRTDVPALPFYDRVVLQWKGDTGLQLHAREFGAGYYSDGHVWAASAGDLGRTARGEGGFMTLLGDPEAEAPLLAEVYSFPIGTARKDGTVAVTIEAEVSAENCGTEVAAQTLERHDTGPVRVRDLTLDMPGCDDASGFLVLKNLVENLKIAAR
ncbi:translocase [Salipiger aestuarii]|uniref:translocase n=1 Tax=Salipiger aestuarii TaxID=568098 RepID=UPI00123B9C86|nr:translocase [Salipiger aestuarii]KAA8608598.1 translocase [Salipiger aestuarii]